LREWIGANAGGLFAAFLAMATRFAIDWR